MPLGPHVRRLAHHEAGVSQNRQETDGPLMGEKRLVHEKSIFRGVARVEGNHQSHRSTSGPVRAGAVTTPRPKGSGKDACYRARARASGLMAATLLTGGEGENAALPTRFPPYDVLYSFCLAESPGRKLEGEGVRWAKSPTCWAAPWGRAWGGENGRFLSRMRGYLGGANSRSLPPKRETFDSVNDGSGGGGDDGG